MHIELSPRQDEARSAFRGFVKEHIAPHADRWDREGALDPECIGALRQAGYLGAMAPAELGGGGMDAITYGLLTEEIGRGCSSVRSLLTVHDMITLTVGRWASEAARERWHAALARAEKLGALALSEPEIGSDAAGVQTTARRDGDAYILNGRKKWITFGQIADLFLAFAQVDGKVAAFLVPADAPGFERQPISDVVGTRASHLAELRFEDCRIPADQLVGRVGFGFSHIASTALDHGRYSVAWGAVGIAQACLDATLDYTQARHQFGARLAEHQLVQRKLTEMIANTRAARLLCYRAGHLRAQGDPSSVGETMIAKYFASRTATRSANDAVQLHGANGLSEQYPLMRYLRDARVTEIIEGSTQIQQITIPRFPLAEL